MASNLPPGCRLSDIPGNRPEGVAEEAFWGLLASKLAGKPRRLRPADAIYEMVSAARAIAYEEGYNDGCAAEQMAQAYRDQEREES